MAESEEVRESTWDACEVKMDLIRRIDFFQPDIAAVMQAAGTDIFIVFFSFALYSCVYVLTQYTCFIYSMLDKDAKNVSLPKAKKNTHS